MRPIYCIAMVQCPKTFHGKNFKILGYCDPKTSKPTLVGRLTHPKKPFRVCDLYHSVLSDSHSARHYAGVKALSELELRPILDSLVQVSISSRNHLELIFPPNGFLYLDRTS